MKKLLLVLVMSFSVQLMADDSGWHLETVMGYTINQSGIAFQVYDGGCTRPDDFFIEVKKNRLSESIVTLYRKKLDRCKAFFPFGLTIKFTYETLGIYRNEVFKINNPINPGFISDP